MTSVQFRVIRKRDEKLLGFIVGKTTIGGKPYLLVDQGGKVKPMPVNESTNLLYRVDKVEVKS